MLIRWILIGALVFLFILLCQRLIDHYSKDNESMRKFVHVLHGVGIAILALVAPMSAVIIVETFFLLSMFVARYLYEHFSRLPWVRYLGRVYSVGRVSYGDFFYPISAITITFFANSEYVFAASILILGLADAVAALVGKRFGKGNSYRIFGQKKSLAGSTAFFVVAAVIIGIFSILGWGTAEHVNIMAILGIALIVTITENLGVYGSDNLLIPIVSTVLLNRL